MVRVAVAGGTGGLGRTIVEALEEDGTHDVVVLTRKTGHPPNAETNSSPSTTAVIPTDYTNPESIAQTLNEHNIHTVISTIVIKSEEQRDAQLNLIRGSALSSSVKRFTPSEFGTPRKPFNDTSSASSAPTPSPTDYKSQAVAELEATHLEYTLFSHGIFMDYQGMPRIQSHLTPWVFAIDLAHKVAGIPGSGDVACVYTYSRDVARFVAAAAGLPDGAWKKQSVMVGQRQTLNQVLRTAESILGAFDAFYESVSKEVFQRRFAGFGMAMEQGAFDFEMPSDGVLLNDLFPHIRPKTMREVIEEGWA
ncbi:Oxidoreductase BOA1 [Cladobotryum mycophilum]|uniref:Oxidoreductase BOA1 n=1 Tax=Cladobotryum mycophilum TaxID=491253 RepID=A0ABR0S6B3_9HYPO